MIPRDDDGPETITVCPNCDGSWVHRRTTTIAKNETDIPEYHCQHCGEAFDDAPEVVADV